MATLRSNLIVSTAAFLVVGAIRPSFNAVVVRAFGAEVNGHAANLAALIFLASLPATAGLPTVMVRHVSRSYGANARSEGAAYARFGTWMGCLLTALGIAAALAHGVFQLEPPLGATDAAVVALGAIGYGYWRLYRGLLVSADHALLGLKAEIGSVGALGVGLATAVLLREREIAYFAFISVYLVFAVLTLHAIAPLLRGGWIPPEGRASLVRYAFLWFVASGSSLAIKELSILLLDVRADRTVLGEFSVSLSFLMMLALAPRIMEVPLLHELSTLAGRKDLEAQRALTERSLDWMTILMLAAGGGAALLAGPILSIVAGVTTPAIVFSFVLLSAAFTTEMIVSPANNLLLSEAHPRILAWIGAGSLAASAIWWISPLGSGFWGVVWGLALAHVLRAVWIAAEVRLRFSVALLLHPVRKILTVSGMGASLYAVYYRDASPWIALAIFELSLGVIFLRELRGMFGALLSKRRESPGWT